jgi:hypothetical protein
MSRREDVGRGSGRPGSGGGIDDRIDWIDTAEDDVRGDIVDTRLGRRRGRWRYVGAALLVLAALVIVRVQTFGGHRTSAATPTPRARAATSAPPSPTSAAPSTGPALPLILVSNLGHPILAAPTGWDLFGLGPGYVVRIELASGRVTRTMIPMLDSSGPTSFVVGPKQAVIRPLDLVTGYQVPDGAIAGQLPPGLRTGGPALPGPSAGQLWLPVDGGRSTKMILIGFDGKALGPSITEPAEVGPMSADGAGYLLFSNVGGVYDARPSGTQRITTGSLLATGPTRWLTEECDDRYRCTTVVTERATGAQRTLPVPVDIYQPFDGVIAPDGNTAAMLESDSNGHATLHLLDLNTGSDSPTKVTLDQPEFPGPNTMVWTPDSRTVFVVDSTGAPVLVDRTSGATRGIGVAVPMLNQLALRSG